MSAGAGPGMVGMVGAARLGSLVSMTDAIGALEAALRAGLDPSADPARPVVGLESGQLLVMPAEYGGFAGVKLATVAPANPSRSLPRIQGTYVLFDSATLAPVMVFDGAGLTALRTPALSGLAVRRLADPDAGRMVVFGTGPQAWGHVRAFRAVRPVTRVDVVGRDRSRIEAFVARCRAGGLSAAAAAPTAVTSADLVACCTTSREPLFDGDLLPDRCTVVAVGSHEPDAREVDDRTVVRSTVVVEDATVALREAGDVIGPVRRGVVDAAHVSAGIADLVRGRVVLGDRPRLFKSVGMAWQDLVVATEAYRCAVCEPDSAGRPYPSGETSDPRGAPA
ncbi:MAG TPA: ornithine cyclodeaminase family protein [Mycobacteriales bacterium]|nr:ornithine cyclodeaminase family protein [Mycobacteriales bacterium]